MRKRLYVLALMAVAALGTVCFTSCGEDEPEEDPYSEYNDSTGLAITDSIVVNFGDTTWKTLNYKAVITQQEYSVFRWADIYAYNPDPEERYPMFYLRIFLEPAANHTNYRSVNDPGQGYTVPGAMTGDLKGGAVRYYEKETLHSPDGTNTSDWWPLQLTTSVLKYDNEEGKLTARVTATMFNYKQWITPDTLSTWHNVADCETRELSITFGGLPLLNK